MAVQGGISTLGAEPIVARGTDTAVHNVFDKRADVENISNSGDIYEITLTPDSTLSKKLAAFRYAHDNASASEQNKLEEQFDQATGGKGTPPFTSKTENGKIILLFKNKDIDAKIISHAFVNPLTALSLR